MAGDEGDAALCPVFGDEAQHQTLPLGIERGGRFIEQPDRRPPQEETRKALAAAEAIQTRAREAAAQERALMMLELKGEVGRLVVQTTAAVAGRVLTPEDQRRLAEETARRLPS